MIASCVQGFTSPVKVLVQGGDTLVVSFQSSGEGFADVRLNGPADFSFTGAVEV